MNTTLENLYENVQIDNTIPQELANTLSGIKTFQENIPEIYHVGEKSFKEFLTSKVKDDNSNAERGIYFSGSKEGTMEYINKQKIDSYLYIVSTDGINFADGDADISTISWLLSIYLHNNPNGIDYYEEHEIEWYGDFLANPNWSKIPKWLPDTLEAALIHYGIDGCIYDGYSDYGEDFPKVYCVWNTKKLTIISKEPIRKNV